MSLREHEFLIDLDGLMWCGDECPADGEHYQGNPPEPSSLTRDDLWVRDTVKKDGEWVIVDHPCSAAEFAAIAQKEGYAKLDEGGSDAPA